LIALGVVLAVLGGISVGLPAFAGTSPTPQPGRATPDIIGGHAPSQPYPGMVSLQVFRGADDPQHHTCGAVLVTGLWVATAAHCVTDESTSAPMAAGLFHVRIGSADRTTGGEFTGVSQILVNANWAWPNTGPAIVGDMAMLKLDTYVQRYQPFEIAPRMRLNAATRLRGWGISEPNGDHPLPVMLQELDTRVLRPTGCPADYLIGADQLCVLNPNGTDGPCRGDSGGPALQRVAGSNPVRWAVVGGAFAGPHFCGTGPALYTDWTYWRSWMFEVMRTGVVPPRVGAAASIAAGVSAADWHSACIRACNV
jgi:secreted trypsin-like serine protease